MLVVASVEETLKEIRHQELNRARGVPVDVDRLIEASLLLAGPVEERDLVASRRYIKEEVWSLEDQNEAIIKERDDALEEIQRLKSKIERAKELL